MTVIPSRLQRPVQKPLRVRQVDDAGAVFALENAYTGEYEFSAESPTISPEAEGSFPHGIVCGSVESDEKGDLISSDKIEGTPIYDRQGYKLGSILSIMIDKRSGKVAYAVMSSGGFLGIGESYHPLPWDVLTYDFLRGGYVTDLNASILKGAPSYSTTEMPDWSDPEWSRRVEEYYDVRRWE